LARKFVISSKRRLTLVTSLIAAGIVGGFVVLRLL
jgi:hypothetical protein